MLYALLGIFALLFLLVSRAAAKSARPFASGFYPALGGLAALAGVNALSFFTGVSIAVNYATAAAAVLLGAPGVVLLLALRALALF
ncbi:MAG: pro-sigmaK processing inhibitor BofA family protein [Oscillospiraceae bacterium]|nr:pro-sigmaK processing inhibitor BofA family protein [Oscillospiraceae bacterium]